MTLADAIRQIESRFQVCSDVGYSLTSYGTDDSEHETGARDWSKAPCGERYLAVVSNGIKVAGEPVPVMFADEAMAIRWWTYAVMDLAQDIAPEAEWSKLWLYWREKPVFETIDYMPVDQAGLLQSASPLSIAMVTMGTVYSRLLISRLGPDGSEEP